MTLAVSTITAFPMTDRERTRLYLITPPRIEDPDAFAREFEAALSGGDVAALQIRCKTGDKIDQEMTRAVAEAIRPMAHENSVAIFINDSVDLAIELDVDGVHIGQSDGNVKEARETLGADRILGVTCHDSRHLAMEAGEAGADYVAFGAFYPTETKEAPTRAEPDILTAWQTFTELPCVAIGGITPETAAPLVEAGADFIAVSSAVWSHPDGPKTAVEAFNAVIDGVFADHDGA